MSRKPLTKAQRQHLERLMVTLKNAEADAQRFLGYCATEAGIEIGQDGWQFDLDAMCFEQQQPEMTPLSAPPPSAGETSSTGLPGALRAAAAENSGELFSPLAALAGSINGDPHA